MSGHQIISMFANYLNCGAITWIFLASVLAFWYFYQLSGTDKMPPGPFPYPIIGNAHLLLGGNSRTVFEELRKKYGDIFTFHFGPLKQVVLNSYEACKEAMTLEQFTAKPSFENFTIYPPDAGVLTNNGSAWRTNRKVCVRHLAQLGFGKKSFEPTIMRELTTLLAVFENKRGEPFTVETYLSNATANVLCGLVFGKHYDWGEKEFSQLSDATDRFDRIPFYLRIVPLLSKLPVLRQHATTLKKALTLFDDISDRHLDDHKHDTSGTLENDLMHAYLADKAKVKEAQCAYDPSIFEDYNLKLITFELIMAGTETTATTLRWMLAYLINFPDAQEKLRAEIENVVGADRPPSLSDKTRMPFTLAFIEEVLRIAPIVPHLPRTTVSDEQLRAYLLPKNTAVICNLHAANMDEKRFPNPHTFRPERFINSLGEFNSQLAKKCVSFGVGKRVCLGEALARMELFLFITSMVQRFVFKCREGDGNPSLAHVDQGGTVLPPQSFEMCALSLN